MPGREAHVHTLRPASAMSVPEGRIDALLVLAILTYFGGQVALRLVLGGAFETDEAEMMVMTPGYQLGYGPQLPLYNWAQLTLFHLFGRDLFALSLLKNLLLAATYCTLFAGLRLWLPARLAAVAVLALFLVPDMAWEAERATTHSNMMLAACGWTVAVFCLWLRRGGWGTALLLGLALGLGGLSKYNFWLVPVALMASALTLSELRRRMFRLPLLLSALVAAAILWAPMAWIAAQKAVALSSTGKLQLALGQRPLAPLPDLAEGFAALLLLPLLVIALIRLAARLRRRSAAPQAPEPAQLRIVSWLLRAGLIALALTVAGMMAAGMGTVTSRWLLPVVVLLVPALALRLLAPLRTAGLPGLAGVALVLALGVGAGLVYDRYKPGARRDVEFGGLPALLETVAPLATTPVAAEFYTAGNLAHQRPDVTVAPLLPFAAATLGQGPLLVILREDTPRDVATAIEQGGWVARGAAEGSLRILDQGSFTLPYGHADATMPFRYALVEIAPPAAKETP